MKKYILFDLDGTLINSVSDLATAVNHSLKKHGYPEHPKEAYYHFVGDGVFKLIERTVPLQYKYCEAVKQSVKKDFDDYYRTHYAVATKPYSGIPELLSALKKHGCRLAVVSNKPHEFSCDIVSGFFPGAFDDVLGHSPKFPKKPDPASVNFLIENSGISKSDCVMIGDSNVDVFTGKNAKIDTIGVSWGFRGTAELKQAGADFIADSAQDILDFIL